MAGYGVRPTAATREAASRPVMTPRLIHDWARYGQSRGNVKDLPAWLASVLRHVTGPPPNGNGNGSTGGHRRGARRRDRQRESTWTQAELEASRTSSLATCPIWVVYGCADPDEYLALSDAETQRRRADAPRCVTEWAEKQTDEVAAVRAVGGVYYDGGKLLPITG
jgi:hypothetical protein